MFYKKTIKSFLKIVGSASKRWWGKDPFMQSAVIAYYAIFAMPGLLVIVVSLFGIVMFLFALLYKILPDAKIQWKHIWLGSIIAAFLFILGKTAIGFYLSKIKSRFGIWCSRFNCFNSSVGELFFHDIYYGAEFTRAYADHFTGKVSATEVAVKIPGKEH